MLDSGVIYNYLTHKEDQARKNSAIKNNIVYVCVCVCVCVCVHDPMGVHSSCHTPSD